MIDANRAAARIADRYEPIELLGRGGEASVFKAVDVRHGRIVALKVRMLPPGGASDELLNEARALLSLSPHPGLAHARDDLLTPHEHVLVLDWVEGVDLGRVLSEEGRPGLPSSTVLRWIAQCAEALTVLHHNGIVHGDVKPSNLIVDSAGRLVVVDLGSSSTPLTERGGGGTSGFRAPEVAAGAAATRASDVFSLAATAFALLTGSAPTGEPPSWVGIDPTVAPHLEAALRAGLAIDPTRRPATPGQLVELLRAGRDDRTPTGVVTVLLTGLISSTAMWQQRPDQVPAMLAELDLVVDRNVEANGGRRIGRTVGGDATMSVFDHAVDAVLAAVGMQRELHGRPSAARIRAGIATGETVSGGGDVAGPTVSRAALVRDLAHTGEILLASSTAAVVRLASVPGVGLLDLGEHRHLGAGEPDGVFAVVSDGVARPADPARSPYPGLASFTRHDADLFVGREAIVEQCLALFEAHRFVAVVGASGSGKTSLALAGLATRFDGLGDLERGVIVIRPGAAPDQAVAEALAAPDAVLIVDQLEELVTLCDAPDERQRFVDRIVNHSGGLVVTLRADLYGEFGAYPELAARLGASQVLLGPLARDDVRRAVLEPAERCGLRVEEGLADLITEEIAEAPGALPLLGHALREAWLRRDGRTITVEGYRASGGVRSAVAATAERAFDALAPADREVARNVLLHMVELRRDGDDVRRWAAHDELADADAVVQTLAASRLLVIDGSQVTVVHEALLRAWPRLSGWIAEERAELVARQELRWAARRWDAGGRDDDDLPRGLRLESAIEIAAAERLVGPERDFVDAARRLGERGAIEARRRTRRLRGLASAASVLAVGALIVGAVAWVQRNDAQDARAAADAAALQADEQRGAAEAATRDAQIQALVGRSEAVRATQRDTSALLAAEAFRLADTPLTRSALFTTFTAADGFLDSHRLGDEVSPEGGPGIVMPDGTTAFYLDRDGRPRPYDLETGDLGDPLPVISDPGDPYSLLASADHGRLLAQAAWLGSGESIETVLGIFDVATATLRLEPVVIPGGVTSIDFADDGEVLAATIGYGAALTTIDTTTGTTISTAPPSQPDLGTFDLNAVMFVGDDLVATASATGLLRILDPITLAERRTIEIAPATAGLLGDVGDGTIVTAGGGGLNRVDLTTGEVLWTQSGQDLCHSLLVDSGRGHFFCGNGFGRLDERDLASGVVVRALGAQNGNAGELELADGGRTLVSFGVNEPVVSRWRLDGTGPITSLIAPGFDPEAFDVTGTRLVVTSGDTAEEYETRVVDVDSGELVVDLSGILGPSWIDAGTVGGALFDAEGRMELVEVDVATGKVTYPGEFLESVGVEVASDAAKEVVLVRYDTDDPEISEVQVLGLGVGVGRIGPVIRVARGNSIAVSRTGHRVVAGRVDDGIGVYDGWTGEQVGVVSGAGAFVTSADQLFTTTRGGDLTLYDLETLEPIRHIGGSLGYIQRVSGTTDGSIIAAIGGDRLVTLFDVATGTRLGTPLVIDDDDFNIFALSPEGASIALPGGGGTLVWSLEPERWLEAACAVAGRNLTRDEWQANIGELAPYRETCPGL